MNEKFREKIKKEDGFVENWKEKKMVQQSLCICRYTDIWKNKLHDDNLYGFVQQNAGVNTIELSATIQNSNMRQVRK